MNGQNKDLDFEKKGSVDSDKFNQKMKEMKEGKDFIRYNKMKVKMKRETRE